MVLLNIYHVYIGTGHSDMNLTNAINFAQFYSIQAITIHYGEAYDYLSTRRLNAHHFPISWLGYRGITSIEFPHCRGNELIISK